MLRAHVIFWCGDIPAITKLMRITGHNSYMGCRFCDLRGVTSKEPGKNHVYYPLKPPLHSQLPIYDPSDLPLRTHDIYYERAEKYIEIDSKTARKNFSKDTGNFSISLYLFNDIVHSLNYSLTYRYKWKKHSL